MPKRAFNPHHILHIDGTGALVRIVFHGLTFDYHGLKFPLLGVRWDREGTVEELRYTLTGGFHIDGVPNAMDLSDADLTAIKATRVLNPVSEANYPREIRETYEALPGDCVRYTREFVPEDALRVIEHAPPLTLAEAQTAWDSHVRGEIDIDSFTSAKETR